MTHGQRKRADSTQELGVQQQQQQQQQERIVKMLQAANFVDCLFADKISFSSM